MSFKTRDKWRGQQYGGFHLNCIESVVVVYQIDELKFAWRFTNKMVFVYISRFQKLLKKLELNITTPSELDIVFTHHLLHFTMEKHCIRLSIPEGVVR